ncbi:MAG: GtrA family protein [Clostridia bacterium]|nr:GtrA family protein [Clostridia bacterium]MBR3108275.1 GtrA family protein [Clostridia bacterium]
MNKKSGLLEGLRFIVTGGGCALVQFAALVLLRDVCGMNTLLAEPIAFLISVIPNYLLCAKWVFGGAKDQGNAARLGFLVTSVMGLLLNELLMYIFGNVFGEDQAILTLFGFTVKMYMVNNVLSIGIVMVWNYFTKRAILKKGLLGGRKKT